VSSLVPFLFSIELCHAQPAAFAISAMSGDPG
jgi:hypothetical protein